MEPVVQPAWDNHFAAFGSQDVSKVLLDYCEQSKIVVYNWHDDTETEFNGIAGAKECFTGLFAALPDLSGLAAPEMPLNSTSVLSCQLYATILDCSQ